MTTYRIRNYYCVICDTPRRAKSELIDNKEQLVNCFECLNPLMNIGTMDLKPFAPQLNRYDELRQRMQNMFRFPEDLD